MSLSPETTPRRFPRAVGSMHANSDYRRLSLAMCPPTYFDVVYSVNPWMDPSRSTDCVLARAQWKKLYDRLCSLGHRVHLIDPLPGQPDMVFTANAAIVVGDRGVSARFRHPFRHPEQPVYHRWLEHMGIQMRRPEFISEGEGDFVVVPGSRPGAGLVFAGDGVRTESRAHDEVADYLELEVVPLKLIDDRFYHLDTALSVIDARTAIYFPGAFADAAIRTLSLRFKRLIPVMERDATVFGANAVSDGRHVLLEATASGLAAQVEAAGYVAIPVEMSELRKSGGAVRCCVLEFY